MKIHEYLNNQTIMDNEYLTQFSFFTSDDKTKVEGMLKNFHGIRDLYDFEYYDSETDFVKSTVLSLFYQRQYEWEKLHETIIADYDFLHNMELTTTTKDITDDTTTLSGRDTTTSSGSATSMPATTTTTENYQNAYDSSTPSLDSRQVTNDSGESTSTSEDTGSVSYGKVTKYDGISDVTVKQIGRTDKPQELIQKEREIAKLSLLRDITDSIANVIAYQIW